jgi:spore coat-associated protein N
METKHVISHRKPQPAKARSLGKPILLTIAVLSATGALAGFGTFAAFTSTDTVTQGSLASGMVTIAVPAAGATNRLTLGASGLVPGDTMQRAVDLQNSGTTALASLTLTTTAPTSSLLDTDATNGLQLVIDRCSQAWTEAGTTPAFTYTCGGTTSTVLATRAVIGSNLTLSNLTSLTTGNTDHLRVTLTFPGSAPTTLQGQTSAITYAFTGTQRAATNQ